MAHRIDAHFIAYYLLGLDYEFVGRTEQTPFVPELRSLL